MSCVLIIQVDRENRAPKKDWSADFHFITLFTDCTIHYDSFRVCPKSFDIEKASLSVAYYLDASPYS